MSGQEARPGDVLVFRWRRGSLAKHCAIQSKPTAMIHALEGAPVSEVALSPWWRRHLAAAFVFPEANPCPLSRDCTHPGSFSVRPAGALTYPP